MPAAAVGLGKPGDLTTSVRTGPSLYFFYGTARTPSGRFFGKGAITAASLTGPSGPVEVRTVDNKTPAPDGSPTPLGAYLAPGGIVIPVSPLAKNATYTASVAFTPDSGEPPVTRTWSFSTGASIAPGGGTTTPGTPAEPTLPVPTGGPVVGGPGATPPKFTSIKLKKRSVSFDATGGLNLWVTVEKRTARATRRKPARWATKRSLPVTAVSGANRVVVDKLAKATYRVRLRDASAKGKILAEKVTTLR